MPRVTEQLIFLRLRIVGKRAKWLLRKGATEKTQGSFGAWKGKKLV
jgi:hypothetical protein